MKIIVPEDKTRNFYKMEKDCYKELLNNNITKEYKKVDSNVTDDISKGDKAAAERLEIDDRLYCTQRRDAFITLKDHKQNFIKNPKCSDKSVQIRIGHGKKADAC